MLKNILEKHLEKEIPVVAVVAVMGTTEESAIDPLTEILKIRKDFSKKVRDRLAVITLLNKFRNGVSFMNMRRDNGRFSAQVISIPIDSKKKMNFFDMQDKAGT